ncbi:hypothetical protein JR316_0008937 [Psilocybe cubensis]|uniref:Protein kinase domain-containing protein n=2 Tax=Psilocybe cubensis TaxID=181762 RepID=A0A8H7XY70_PSICU|nr:hypothetical protein JR316_0008937 [Psilocybe cubensis]KAH9478482.1 hypothetical protein JR316_0008937 [Psilocybe cubensis]
MDATRVSDGARVVMKQVFLEEDNVPLLEYLNSPEMRADPRNNTVPLLEVIPVPSQYKMAKSRESAVLLVMPLLFPLMSWSFPFQHVREIVEVIEQLINGIVFLHEHRIAHRLVPNAHVPPAHSDVCFHYVRHYLHPDGKSRAVFKDRCLVAPVKYYMIDYETAEYFPPNILSEGRYGQIKTVPEWSLDAPYDPFKLDVYQLGCQVKGFAEEYKGLKFLKPLYIAMTRDNPDLRPTAADSLRKFKEIIDEMDPASLKREIWIKGFNASQLARQKAAMAYSPPETQPGIFRSINQKLSNVFGCLLLISSKVKVGVDS